MQDGLAAVAHALQGLGDELSGALAFALVSAGTIAMATLQLVKELTPLRRKFQRHWLQRWVRQRIAAYNAASRLADGKPAAAEENHALTCMVELATGNQEDAFYNLDICQLVAQVNAAAQITLDYPTRYLSLLAVLSEGVAVADVATVLHGPPVEACDFQLYLDARARVGHRIQRNLDGVQIALGDRWQFWMQILALALTTAVVELAVLIVEPATPRGWQAFAVAVPIGIVGGYIAPVARDLVAALQSLRRA